MTDEPTMPADEIAPETRKTGYPAVSSPSSYPPAKVAIVVKTDVKAGFLDDPHGAF